MEVALASKMKGTFSAPKEYIVIHLVIQWKIFLLAEMHRIYTRYFKLSSNSVQWNKTNFGRLDLEEDGRHWAPSKRPLPVYIFIIDAVRVKTLCLFVQHRTAIAFGQLRVGYRHFVTQVSNAMLSICSQVTKILLPSVHARDKFLLFHHTSAIPTFRHHATCDVTDSFQNFR